MQILIAAAIVVAVPVAFDPGGYFTFLPIKWALASVLVSAGIGAVIVDRGRLPRPPGSRPWLLFLALMALSSVLGVGGATSWLGYPGRYLGVIAWLVAFGAFVLGASIDPRRGRDVVLLVASAASLAVSLYAILQALGADPIAWNENIDVSRARSTLGNAAFLGAYLAMIVPLAVRLAISSAGRTRAFHASAAAAATVALLATQTRGALLGALLGLGVIGALELRRMKRRRGPVIVAAAAGVVVLVLLATFSPYAQRVRSVVDPQRATGRGRLLQWDRTIDMIASRPALGWGPDTYAMAFPAYIDAEFEREVGREVVPDRAHNVLLDIGASAGVTGVAAYVAILAMFARAAFRRRGDATAVALSGACAAYVGQLQFSFPLADLDVVFWLLAGLLVAPSERSSISLSRAWAVAPFVVAAALAVWGGTDVVADRVLRAGLDAEADGDADSAARDADRAAGISVARAQYAQAAARLHLRVAQATGNERDIRLGLDVLEDVERLVPGDVELALDRGDLLLSMGEISGDEGALSEAASAYEAVLVRDPWSSRAHLKLGVAYVQLGREGEAEKEWLTAADLAPRSPAPLDNLARLYRQQGRDADARRIESRAMELGR